MENPGLEFPGVTDVIFALTSASSEATINYCFSNAASNLSVIARQADKIKGIKTRFIERMKNKEINFPEGSGSEEQLRELVENSLNMIFRAC